MALNIPPKGDSFRRAGAHFANLEVSPQDTPDMTVKTSAGGFWDDNTTYVEHNGGTSPTLTAPSGNAKLTVIALNLSGALVLIDGAEAASPSLPVIPSDRIPLGVVLLNTTDTVIDDSMVFDLRPILQIGADVNNLTVSEIVGLDAQLALKADTTALTNGLAGKADIIGTACSIFSLNANHTGAPTADASFRVTRGAQADVELRWNETSEVWEFTNDGTDFQSISSASNQGSQITALQASVTRIDASIVNINASLVNLHASVDQNSTELAVASNFASNTASVLTVHTTELATASNFASNAASQITALQASTTRIDASIVNINASLVQINSSLVDLHASVDQNSTDIATLIAASTHPVNLTAFRSGLAASQTIFWIWPVGTSTTIPTQATLGTALAGTVGGGSATDISIKHSASVGAAGSTIGTVKFPPAASAEGTVDVSTLALVVPGDYLWASLLNDDAVLADIAFTITATKTTT